MNPVIVPLAGQRTVDTNYRICPMSWLFVTSKRLMNVHSHPLLRWES